MGLRPVLDGGDYSLPSMFFSISYPPLTANVKFNATRTISMLDFNVII